MDDAGCWPALFWDCCVGCAGERGKEQAATKVLRVRCMRHGVHDDTWRNVIKSLSCVLGLR